MLGRFAQVTAPRTPLASLEVGEQTIPTTLFREIYFPLSPIRSFQYPYAFVPYFTPALSWSCNTLLYTHTVTVDDGLASQAFPSLVTHTVAAVVQEVLGIGDTILVRTPAGPADTDPPVGVERLGKDACVACAAILVRPLSVWPPHHFRPTLEVFLCHGAASGPSSSAGRSKQLHHLGI